MTFKRALVREPSNSFPSCISSHPLHHSVSVKQAKLQHQKYCEVLTELGLEVFKLPPDDRFPDSCFVEDTAIIHKDRVLISRLGARSRRGEEHEIREYLDKYLKVKEAAAPATIEGGDVIHLPQYLISGISQRTNKEGVMQLADWLQLEVKPILDKSIIHLKSHVTFLERNTVIVNDSISNHPVFRSFAKIVVPTDEEYAANTLTINGVVLIPDGYPKTAQKLMNAGFEIIQLEMSEFQKCEGALTCLSLLL